MTEHELLRRFPNASKSMLARNALTLPPPMTITPTTDHAKLNKTEAAYYSYLKTVRDAAGIYVWVGTPQCITLKLGDDCRYTPDFFAINHGGEMLAFEVKGFWRDDAKVKIKVAARIFPFIRFQVVMKNKDQWSHTPIKP